MRGFSLIEMLVVMSIFSLISMVVIANHSKFNSSVLLGNLAYDIALSIREAQVYGLSVRQFASEFQIGYGVHFSGTDSYVFFADINRNGLYDNPGDSIIQTYSLGRGHSILRYCADAECSDSASNNVTYLDVVFFRPDPDASFATNRGTSYSEANIVVTSPAGATRTIAVQTTGQISVTNP